MEIKEWDFNQKLFGADNNSIVKMHSGITRNSDTNKPTGIYFRWTYWLQKNNTTVIKCVAQDLYRLDDSDLLIIDNSAVLIMLNKSFRDYIDIVNKRLTILNEKMPILSFDNPINAVSLLVVVLKS